jgi:hypothetical protein
MTLPKPDLDDRRFGDLAREGQLLIPRSAPAWTDHNLSDPGITLLELFAWLTEVSLYRLNLVTPRHRLAYLALLGTRPRPPQASSVYLAFQSPFDLELGSGTPVTTRVNGKEVPFELGTGGWVTRADLRRVVVDERTGIYDRSGENLREGRHYAPFGLRVQPGSALCLGFAFPGGPPQGRLSLLVTLHEADLARPGSHFDEPGMDFTNGTLRWEYCTGADARGWSAGWQPVVPAYDGTRALKRSGLVLFPDLPGWRDSLLAIAPSPPLLFWLRCVVDDTGFEYPPRIESIRPTVFPAVQGISLPRGGGGTAGPGTLVADGTPHQAFELGEPLDRDATVLVTVHDIPSLNGFSPEEIADRLYLDRVAARGLALALEASWNDPSSRFTPRAMAAALGIPELLARDILGLVAREYTEVPDLGDSGPGDDHFVLDRAAGRVHFGNGVHGTIPAARSEIRFRLGGGREGNLPAGREWQVEGLPGLSILNPGEASGGAPAETLAEAVKRCLVDLRTPSRAVTSGDFEELAKNTPGLRVAVARAVPDTAAGPGELTGTVTVVVLPAAIPGTECPPAPSAGFLGAVCRHLDRHRLLGTAVRVTGPDIIRVSVQLTAVPARGAHRENLRGAILDRLRSFINPYTGGPEGKGWPIGRPVYPSEIFDEIDQLDGVECVTRVRISGDRGTGTDRDGILGIPRTATVCSGTHAVTVVEEEAACRRKRDGTDKK